MKKLIVTADDYGVFPAVNRGVFAAIDAGKVNSVAAFSNFKGDDKYPGSVENAKALLNHAGDKVDIGCHLTITSGKPLTGDKMNFACTDKGFFRSFGEFNNFREKAQLDALEEELFAQVDALRDAGIPVKHLTNHHNSLTFFQHHFEVYMRVARKLNLPMRSANIQPDDDQRQFNAVLRFLLIDNLKKEERKEMKKFATEIVGFFQQNAAGVKAPDILNSIHYGPLPMRDVFPMAMDKLTRRKHVDLDDILINFNNSGDTSLELMLHLGAGDLDNIDTSPDLDYPGVDRKYFDSRIVELNSIVNYKLDALAGIEQKRWADL